MSTFTPISAPLKQQLLAQLCAQMNDAISILDADLRYMAVNVAYEKMIGYDEAFLLGRPLGIYAAEFLTEKERHILQDIRRGLAETGFYENDFVMATRYGQMLDCHVTYYRIDNEHTTYHVGMIRDNSSVIHDKQQLRHLLNYNHLTGLPNRKVFLSQASDLLMDSYQEVVIVRINIDRYRTLTNTLGQDTVNTLIKQFVARVKKMRLNHLHSFAHFGGDDFALLFECPDAQMVRHQLDSLMQMCEQPFTINLKNTPNLQNTRQHKPASPNSPLRHNALYLHISVGVSYFPQHSDPLAPLLTKAEKALQYVKQHGGDDCCWYSDAVNAAVLNETSIDSLQLEAELRAAINQQQFIVYYQPKVVLKTTAIIGFEALVRWQHPTRGLLSPPDFMDILLKHKLSFELFEQVVTQVGKQLSVWQQLGLSQRICINADAAEFNHPKFNKVINRLFEPPLIRPAQLHIELTESSLMLSHPNVKQRLEALKILGICLVLDDFGTGYASLSYLQEYDFDFIKIDKSFISKITNDATQQAIVKAILDLAKALEMQVIAEGIETQEQATLLLKMGCKYAQGYWFGRPVAGDCATQMLQQQDLANDISH